MTLHEQTLINFDDFAKKIGLDYVMMASSLLGIIRDGELLKNDPEIDVSILSGELNDELFEDIRGDYHFQMYPCKEKFGEMYLSATKDHDSGPGWIAISPIWERKDRVFVNMLDSQCLLVPDKTITDKSTWSKVEYLGREFNTPHDPKDYLSKWYGDDWETPLSCTWHDNKNNILWEALWD